MLRERKEGFVQLGSNQICWHEWGTAKADKSSILLIHATGFHSRCWLPVVERLGDNHVVAVDLRGHGLSGNTGPFTWDVFGEDIIALLEELDLKNLIGVGHSLGGYALTHVLSEQGHRFVKAILVDPVIMNPEFYQDGVAEHEKFLNESGLHPVAGRRNSFVDSQAMYKNFHGRGSFNYWTDEALHAYCDFGLDKSRDGEGMVLACPPTVEASIYMGSASMNILERVKSIDMPVTVLRAQERSEERKTMDFSKSPTWPELADAFKNGRDVSLPELSHFIPMQDPQLTAEYILGER